MTRRINLWALVGALVLLTLFLLVCCGHVTPYITQVIGVNLWFIVLFGSLATFVFGMVGCADGHNVAARLRSIGTLIVAAVLSAFSAVVLILGNLFQFT